MATGPMQFGNNGVGNNAGPAQTTLDSTVALNPSGIPTATFLVSNEGTGAAVVGQQVGSSERPAIEGENAGGIGVSGQSETGRGVLGASQAGDGVAGISDNRNGVQGTSSSQAASGVYGENMSGGGYGVAGRIVPNTGGLNSVAVYGENNGFGAGVYGFSQNGYGGVFVGPEFTGSNLTNSGGLRVVGEIVKTGGHFSEALPHPDGSMRRMYAPLSPESFYEDFGRGELVEGRARVPLDPDLAAVLGIEHGDYHVFLTPEGDSRGLFVSDRQPDGFDVREQDGGTSTLTFSYRIVAVRSGNKPERMAALVEEETL
jgi:hypothetical protein